MWCSVVYTITCGRVGALMRVDVTVGAGAGRLGDIRDLDGRRQAELEAAHRAQVWAPAWRSQHSLWHVDTDHLGASLFRRSCV